MNSAGLHANNILKGLAVETKRQGSVLKHQVPLSRVAGVDSTELFSQWPLHTHCAVILSQQRHYEPFVFVSRTDCSLWGTYQRPLMSGNGQRQISRVDTSIMTASSVSVKGTHLDVPKVAKIWQKNMNIPCIVRSPRFVIVCVRTPIVLRRSILNMMPHVTLHKHAQILLRGVVSISPTAQLGVLPFVGQLRMSMQCVPSYAPFYPSATLRRAKLQ